jgi:hypothetical protein
MSMKIVPPKQNGENCVIVALCHAANYFGVTPTNKADYSTVRVPTLSKALLDLAHEFLPGLELTLWIHANNVNGGEQYANIVAITNGDYIHLPSEAHEAIIISLSNGDGTYHAMFKVDEFSYKEQCSYVLFIHEPGVNRQ